MSTQRGNIHRKRPQKYQNSFAFKNNLHDKTVKTKTINSLQIANVCERCKKIIEWKIKYKKYKPLKAPGICNKCNQKTVKHAYHTMCGPCAKERKVCPKCGQGAELVIPEPSKEEQLKIDAEMQNMMKTLSERKRRTFIRYVNKQTKAKSKKKNQDDSEEIKETDENSEVSEEIEEPTREDLMNKLKSLMIDKDDSGDEFGSDFSDDLGDLDDNDESDQDE